MNLRHLKIEAGRDLLARVIEADRRENRLQADPLRSKREFVPLANLQEEIRPENLQALQVIPFVDGWHWRLVFCDMPTGYPTGIGNLRHRPLRTEAQATEIATSIAVRLDRIARGNALGRHHAGQGVRYFDLAGVPIGVPQSLIHDAAARLGPDPARGEVEVASAESDLRNLRAFGDQGLSKTAVDGLDDDTRSAVELCLARLMAAGRFTLPAPDLFGTLQ